MVKDNMHSPSKGFWVAGASVSGASVVASPPQPGTFRGQSQTLKAGLKTVPSAQFCEVL